MGYKNMDRRAIVQRLKQLRRLGTSIGIALTAKTDLLVEELQRLEAGGAASAVTSGGYIGESLWHILLRQLNLRTLYRCMLLYRECHRAVSRNLLWRWLIERDLGLVPLFVT